MFKPVMGQFLAPVSITCSTRTISRRRANFKRSVALIRRAALKWNPQPSGTVLAPGELSSEAKERSVPQLPAHQPEPATGSSKKPSLARILSAGNNTDNLNNPDNPNICIYIHMYAFMFILCMISVSGPSRESARSIEGISLI